MSGRRIKKRKSRKRLAYGLIVVAFILILLAYFSLNQSNQKSQPKAALVDHLSRREPNLTFVQNSTSVLEEAGFDVDYYGWGKLTDANFYKFLFKQNYDLFILRVHSAVTTIEGEKFVSFFTWERYSNDTAKIKYSDDVLHDRLVMAFFQEEPNVYYFGITHKFVEKYGDFQNSVIIMMGCKGLTYTSMAEAFVKKGAKVYIGWDGLVGVNHTDQATLDLLQSLILENQTIREAVDEISPDLTFDSSKLDYYPKTAGNYVIPNLGSGLTMNVAFVSPRPKAPTRSKYVMRPPPKTSFYYAKDGVQT